MPAAVSVEVTPSAPGAATGDAGDLSSPASAPVDLIRFAHESERQFALLLDFFAIEWEYEPVEFTLEWDDAGQPSKGFRPDFYLPAYQLFIEITTLNQRLVTKKNRKVRRLRELHPEVDVKVLYQRDYLNLMVKFGLEPLAAGVSPSGAASPVGDRHGAATP